MVFITFRAPSLKWEILRPLGSRGPDASPSGGPQRSQAHCEPPGARPAKTMLHSLVKAAKFDRRPKRSQEHNPFVLGAPPHAPLWRRPRRGRRPKGRTSTAQSPAKSSAQPTAQSSCPCSAQRGGKTDYGFPARRTSTAQSSPQFFALCPPHCGSAFAPPLFRRPRQFLPDWPSANRQNMPSYAGGQRSFRTLSFNPPKTALRPGRPRVPAGTNGRLYPRFLFARLRDSIISAMSRNRMNRFFRRGARLSDRRGLPLRRAGAPTGRFTGRLYPVLCPRACAIHLYSATAEIAESLL